jgi:hypothetical protein
VSGTPSPLRVRLRIAWNYVHAKIHHAYPCGCCGYRYDCPDGECHS